MDAAIGGDAGSMDAGADEVCSWATPLPDAGVIFPESERFLLSVVAAGTGAIAVGAQGPHGAAETNILVRVSCDGESWLPADVPEQRGWLTEVAYGAGRAVILGRTSALPGAESLRLVRRHGEAWQRVTRSIEQQLGQLRFGNGVFLALDANGILRSTDGVEWERVASEDKAIERMRLVFDGERFVSYGGGHLRSSSDGRSWSEQPLPRTFEHCSSFAQTRAGYHAFCGDTYLPQGGDISGTHVYALSAPSFSELGSAEVREQVGLSYTPSVIVPVGDRLVAFSGSDPFYKPLPLTEAAWLYPVKDMLWPTLYAMTFASAKLVAVGYGIAVSRDGMNWSHDARLR